MNQLTDDFPTARTHLEAGWLVEFVWCKACHHQGPADLQAIVDAGRREVPLKDLKFRCAKYGKRPRDMTIKAVVRRLLYALFSWPPSDADKRRIVSEVARQSSIRNLLGTETCEEMVAAQLPNFDKIITIDPDDRLCSSVLKRFAPHPNFDVANGASHQILPRVLLRFSGPVLCWMEGYYRKGSARGKCDAPIWDELRAVFKRNVHGDRVLIDGAHLFALGWLSREYPSISRLRQFVSSEQPNYTVEVRRDIIHIVPKSAIPDQTSSRQR